MRTIAGIFAHPDDEAFGPGGTIALLAKRNAVYLLSATKGQAGKDRGKKARRDLGERRARELVASARILGVRKVYFLGFEDGMLSNNLYHTLAEKIIAALKLLRPEILLTTAPLGGSGHLDHIAVAMVTNYVFDRLPSAKILLQICRTEERARAARKYFIYVPPGYRRGAIDLAVDVRAVWGQKLAAMMAHRSQLHDIRRALAFAKRFPKKEYFLIRAKNPRERRLLVAELFG